MHSAISVFQIPSAVTAAMGTALLCDVGFETVVVNESVRVRSNDGRSIGWGRCCFSQIRLVRNGREETRSDWHVVSPTDTTTSRQTTSSLIGPGQSCSVEPRSDILASLARGSRRPRCDLGGGNHAVHRSTACGVIRMEHQLAVPGDGQRSWHRLLVVNSRPSPALGVVGRIKAEVTRDEEC